MNNRILQNFFVILTAVLLIATIIPFYFLVASKNPVSQSVQTPPIFVTSSSPQPAQSQPQSQGYNSSGAVWGTWSEWSLTPVASSWNREVETQKSVYGYNMVHYGTQVETEPHYRMFRSYSIGNNYKAYGARASYGEKHFTRFVTATQLANARRFEEGTFIKGSYVLEGYGGYQKGSGTAYYFGDDKYVWFIESRAEKTLYRYRDLLYTGKG